MYKAVFFSLLKAGLWGQRVRLPMLDESCLKEVARMATAQSVIGLIVAGLEEVEEVDVSLLNTAPMLASVMRLAQRNAEMDRFVADLYKEFAKHGVLPVLVKGQGVARCYAKPSWRACGDIDLLWSDADYDWAKELLSPCASSVDREGLAAKHLGMKLEGWDVELHGSMRCGLSHRMDGVLDELKKEMFSSESFRVWCDGGEDVMLPSANYDAIFIFTHFLKHFYKGGVGLRQICDWCRLLWVYRDELDVVFIEKHLRAMGLMSEWRAFAAYVVEYLGMPKDAMPLYRNAACWKRKAVRIHNFILRVGNFGQNRERACRARCHYLLRKVDSFCLRIVDICHHAEIFPLDSLRYLPIITIDGLRAAARGE